MDADLLKEAGYEYIMDWPHDDQPIWMRTRSGPILSVPYPAELNDSPQIVHRQHSAREFCDMLVDQFEEMVEQSVKHPLVCNISIHPHTFGYPFRLRPLRRALEHCFSNKFVDRVWAEEFVYTGVHGEVKTKADILAELKAGDLTFEVLPVVAGRVLYAPGDASVREDLTLAALHARVVNK